MLSWRLTTMNLHELLRRLRAVVAQDNQLRTRINKRATDRNRLYFAPASAVWFIQLDHLINDLSHEGEVVIREVSGSVRTPNLFVINKQNWILSACIGFGEVRDKVIPKTVRAQFKPRAIPAFKRLPVKMITSQDI